MIKSPDSLLQNLFKGIDGGDKQLSSSSPDEESDFNIDKVRINPDSALKLKCKSEYAKDNSTVLLHKRPYEFLLKKGKGRQDDDTASFKTKVQNAGQASHFDIQLDGSLDN